VIAHLDQQERTPPRVDLRAVWRPVVFFVTSRVLVVLAFVAAAASHRTLSFHNAASKWDGGFYFHIANHGYPSKVPHVKSVLAFFPGYPLLIRFVEDLLNKHAYTASTIVVFTFGLAATCGIWFLTRELSDVDAADRATALFAFAPGSFVLSMAYTEAVFILFAVAACWALIRRRWILAGVLGACGTITRPDGLALVAAAAAAAYVAIRQRHELRALVAAPLAASGFVAVQLYLWAHTGDPLAFFHAERNGWHQGTTFTGTEVADIRSILRTMSHGGPPDWNHIVLLAGFVMFVAASVVLVRWRPPVELVVFALGMGVFAFTSTRVGFRPRTFLAAFPLAMALGVKMRRGPWFALVLAMSAALLIILAFTTTATLYITP